MLLRRKRFHALRFDLIKVDPDTPAPANQTPTICPSSRSRCSPNSPRACKCCLFSPTTILFGQRIRDRRHEAMFMFKMRCLAEPQLPLDSFPAPRAVIGAMAGPDRRPACNGGVSTLHIHEHRQALSTDCISYAISIRPMLPLNCRIERSISSQSGSASYGIAACGSGHCLIIAAGISRGHLETVEAVYTSWIKSSECHYIYSGSPDCTPP
jgi:hypothetical protein